MSWQGTKWARNIRGVNRGEKAVLMQLGHDLDQRTNVVRLSVDDIAEAAEMEERQIRRILKQLEAPRDGYAKGIIKKISGGLGKHNKSIYSFVQFKAAGKADIQFPEKRTFQPRKADIPAAKADIGDSAIMNIRTSEELQEEKEMR